ncbi:efflux RND transporter periplasmic adaptor subunit [Paenibacillus chartarius]|uniref:Efflux RND transporter periplasmic adaptor subunit n=1 Tax=Paenibacillus chartarius TaxID=747481 RepID=A0ABV6DUL6_9BACL
MKTKSLILGLAAAAAVVGISAFLYIAGKPLLHGAGAAGTSAAPLQLKFPVTREDVVQIVEIKGKSSYTKETWISAPFGADVKRWNVSDGAQVSKGDVLFELDGSELGAEIAQLEVNQRKQELEASLARFQASPGEGAASAAAASTEEEAKQRYAQAENLKLQTELNAVSGEAARKQIEQKRSKLEQAVFPSPESGIFLFGETKEPKLVKDGDRLGKIVDVTKLQLLTTVGEFDVFRIKPGMPVDVKVDALQGVKLKGQVDSVSKFARPGTDSSGGGAAQFEVVISLEPNEKLIAGLSLTGSIETERKSGVLTVPTLAVQQDKEGYFVTVLDDSGQVTRRNVQIGTETADKTEIVSGVQVGETVVLE